MGNKKVHIPYKGALLYEFDQGIRNQIISGTNIVEIYENQDKPNIALFTETNLTKPVFNKEISKEDLEKIMQNTEMPRKDRVKELIKYAEEEGKDMPYGLNFKKLNQKAT